MIPGNRGLFDEVEFPDDLLKRMANDALEIKKSNSNFHKDVITLEFKNNWFPNSIEELPKGNSRSARKDIVREAYKKRAYQSKISLESNSYTYSHNRRPTLDTLCLRTNLSRYLIKDNDSGYYISPKESKKQLIKEFFEQGFSRTQISIKLDCDVKTVDRNRN